MKKMMDKFLLLSVVLSMVWSLVSCGNDNVNDVTIEKNIKNEIATDKSLEDSNIYTEAEEELRNFFDYYNIDINDFENKGEIVISDTKFLFFEDKSEEKYSYYVDIVKKEIYGGYPNAGLDCWWINGGPVENEEFTEEYNASYVPIHLGILDRSFESLKNQIRLTEMTNNPSYFLPFYIAKKENARYFYSEGDIFYGVENDGVSVVSFLLTEGHQIRKTINDFSFYGLYDVQPTVCKISNNMETRAFLYWQVDNGYVGFVILGGVYTHSVYDCVATNMIIVEDLSAINVF